MHELSIAIAIIEVVEKEIPDGSCVESVTVEVGTLTSIVPQSLQFAWSEACKQTLLNDAVLEIKTKDGTGFCKMCQSIVPVSEFRCKTCNQVVANPTGGDVLNVLSIKLR